MSREEQKTAKKRALSLSAYRKAAGLLGPLVDLTLKKRLEQGKEDPERVDERRGIASQDRPEGILVWVHGASVGESLSILPLLERLSQMNEDYCFLVTTGTITSAMLMMERLPEKGGSSICTRLITQPM